MPETKIISREMIAQNKNIQSCERLDVFLVVGFI